MNESAMKTLLLVASLVAVAVSLLSSSAGTLLDGGYPLAARMYAAGSGSLAGVIEKVGEVLTDSGYLSMALTLNLAYPRLDLNASFITIFAPSDAAFFRSGQPNLPMLQFHISPERLHPEGLDYLRPGTPIPTLLPNKSLIVTASSRDGGTAAIDGVKIVRTPIYDDGSIAVYGVAEFLNPSFRIVGGSTAPEPPPGYVGAEPGGPARSDSESFEPASDLLRSGGYSRMATLLDLQLAGPAGFAGLTVFAPTDDAFDGGAKNFSDFAMIFRRHVVPAAFRWTDLTMLAAGASLRTFRDGFSINVSRSGDILVLNGLVVISPDIYHSNWLVVHGLRGLFWSPATTQELDGDSFFDLDGNGGGDQNSSEYGEY